MKLHEVQTTRKELQIQQQWFHSNNSTRNKFGKILRGLYKYIPAASFWSARRWYQKSLLIYPVFLWIQFKVCSIQSLGNLFYFQSLLCFIFPISPFDFFTTVEV